MANTLYYLASHPPKNPDTLVVFDSFLGGGTPRVPTPYVMASPATPLSAGDYVDLDLETDPGPLDLFLNEPANPGDQICIRVTALPAMGAVIQSVSGLSRPLTEDDSIVCFIWDTATMKWIEG